MNLARRLLRSYVFWAVVAGLIYLEWGFVSGVQPGAVSAPAGQGAILASKQVAPFLGTWLFTMTDPPHFKGSEQTVRIWEQNGRVAASVQLGKFPPNNATGIHRDGDMLLLTLRRDAQPPMMENGVPLMVVILLTLDGDEMTMAQMLEHSVTIKRGTGKKQSAPPPKK